MAFRLSRSLFIHIPKTAGQWVVSALASAGVPCTPIGVVHTSPDEILSELSGSERPYTFAMVRHPLHWYQSMWAHQTDDKWEPIDAEDWFTERWLAFWQDFTCHCASSDFLEFVQRSLDHYPHGLVSLLYDIYTARCDFVGKQERLPDDLITALRNAGENFDEPRLRATPPKNTRGGKPHRVSTSKFTRKLAEATADRERWAIERFGYEMIPSSVLRSF